MNVRLERKPFCSKRSKNWNDFLEVQCLISLWEKYYKLLSGSKRNCCVYKQIAAELKNNDFCRSFLEVKFKIKNLSTKYRNETKLAEDTGHPSEWIHYKRIQAIFGDKPSPPIIKGVTVTSQKKPIQDVKCLLEDMEFTVKTEPLSPTAEWKDDFVNLAPSVEVPKEKGKCVEDKSPYGDQLNVQMDVSVESESHHDLDDSKNQPTHKDQSLTTSVTDAPFPKEIRISTGDGNSIAPAGKECEVKSKSGCDSDDAEPLRKRIKLFSKDEKVISHTSNENKTHAIPVKITTEFMNMIMRTGSLDGKILILSNKLNTSHTTARTGAAEPTNAISKVPSLDGKILLLANHENKIQTTSATGTEEFKHTIMKTITANEKIVTPSSECATPKASETIVAESTNTFMATTDGKILVLKNKEKEIDTASVMNTLEPLNNTMKTLATDGKDDISTGKEGGISPTCKIDIHKRLATSINRGKDFTCTSCHRFESPIDDSRSDAFLSQSIQLAGVGYNDNHKITSAAEGMFDIFGKSISSQLKLLPKQKAYAAQLKIQTILTEELLSCEEPKS